MDTGQLPCTASCYLRHVDSDSADALLFLSNYLKDRGELSQAETTVERRGQGAIEKTAGCRYSHHHNHWFRGTTNILSIRRGTLRHF
eukprot:gene4576-9094_t